MNSIPLDVLLKTLEQARQSILRRGCPSVRLERLAGLRHHVVTLQLCVASDELDAFGRQLITDITDLGPMAAHDANIDASEADHR